MNKTKKDNLWNQVIRFTPVALFLVVLTFVAGQAYFSNMSGTILSANSLNATHADDESEDEDDEDADEDDEDEHEDEDESDEDEHDEDDEEDEDDEDDEDDEKDEDNQDETNTGERVVTDGQALEIALRAIGLTAGDVDEFEVEYDESHNVYEIHIRKNILKGTILINATTGSIVEMEKKLEDDEDVEDEDHDALLVGFSEDQKKAMKKLLNDVEDTDAAAFVELVLSLDPNTRTLLLNSNSGTGNNQLYKHVKRLLEHEGFAATKEFLLSENETKTLLEEWEQIRMTEGNAERIEKTMKRLQHFSFTAELADELKELVHKLFDRAKEGSLTVDQVEEFEDAVEDLIEDAKEEKVESGITPFTDVDHSALESPSADFIDDITYLKEEGITNGFPDGTYRGENKITRAELVAMILRAKWGTVGTQQRLSDVDLGVLPPDVPHNNSLARLVALAYEEGITTATDEFGFYRPVTRAEAAVMIGRAFGIELTAEQKNYFRDVTGLNEEFETVINQAAEDGIVSGQDGLFRPADPIRRDEIAKLLHRAILVWLEENPV